jgi:hypothetical protein
VTNTVLVGREGFNDPEFSSFMRGIKDKTPATPEKNVIAPIGQLSHFFLNQTICRDLFLLFDISRASFRTVIGGNCTG